MYLRTGAVDLRVEEIEMLYSRVCVASLSMFECKFENLMKLILVDEYI
jgi:hypothetical protein